MYDAVAALPNFVVKFPVAGNRDSVPAVPEAPKVGVAVKAGVAPARTCPAAPVIAIAPARLIVIGEVPLNPALPTLAIGIAVGNMAVVIEQNEGAPVDPVQFPKTKFARDVESENVSAGVLVAVATDVVNNGESVPALKDVTLPPLAVTVMAGVVVGVATVQPETHETLVTVPLPELAGML